MKTLSHLILMMLILVLPCMYNQAFAEGTITVHTDKTSYSYGDNYTISGRVSPVVPNQTVSVVILVQNYPHPTSLSITPDANGIYSYTQSLPINEVPSGNFTIIAQYGGTKNQTTFSYVGLPCNQQNIPMYAPSAPIIRGPPANNPRIVDSLGNAITGPVKIGQQIQITYDVANGLNCAQPFAYVVQIQDHNGVTVSLSWITGILLAGQSFNPAQSWTPQSGDTYSAQIFLWQSIKNPNALAPPVSVEIDVEPHSNLTQYSHTEPGFSSGFQASNIISPLAQFHSGVKSENVMCNPDLILAIKHDYSPACVSESSAIKLFLHGWAYGFENYQPVYFVKPNSTAQIFVKYSPQNYQGQSPSGMAWSLYSRVYPMRSDSDIAANQINAKAHPDFIYTNSTTIVDYSITTGNVKGIYWLSVLDPCTLIPLAVNLDESELKMTQINAQNPANSMRCPGPVAQFHVVDTSNADLKLIYGG